MRSTDSAVIVLLGATGQIGHALRQTLQPLGRVVALGRDRVDLADPDTIRASLRQEAPRLIVNAAAYTAVDRAEEEPDRAYLVNAVAPGVLAEEARRLDAWLVHYSTDYVFDGTKEAPYQEDDVPRPINVYGQTKLEGEQRIQAAEGSHLILRTSWVYSRHRSNFLRTMLRLAGERNRLRVVDDQVGAPTSADWIAAATAEILQSLHGEREPRVHGGLYHLVSSGQTTWYGFARAIFERFGRSDVEVVPISSSEYPTAAARPAYSVLDTGKVRRVFGVAIPTWSQQLEELYRAMAADAASPSEASVSPTDGTTKI